MWFKGHRKDRLIMKKNAINATHQFQLSAANNKFNNVLAKTLHSCKTLKVYVHVVIITCSCSIFHCN